MQAYFDVGAVIGTHGLKGEVKVFCLSDDPKRFETLKTVIFTKETVSRELEIERVRYFKRTVLLKFRGIDRIEEAEPLKGGSLSVERRNALPLSENEYYIGDLIGMTVFTEEGARLGELTEVLATGANDVYAVRMENGKEVLIPSIAQCVLRVDPERGEMTVRLLEGLL